MHLQQNQAELWCQLLPNYHHLHCHICCFIGIMLLMLVSSAIVERGLLN